MTVWKVVKSDKTLEFYEVDELQDVMNMIGVLDAGSEVIQATDSEVAAYEAGKEVVEQYWLKATLESLTRSTREINEFLEESEKRRNDAELEAARKSEKQKFKLWR